MPTEKTSDLAQMGAYVASDDLIESEAFYAALLGLDKDSC